jgi:hypothetical protein
MPFAAGSRLEAWMTQVARNLTDVGDGFLKGPHQGVGNALIAPKQAVIGSDPMRCRERLGGLLKFYERETA